MAVGNWLRPRKGFENTAEKSGIDLDRTWANYKPGRASLQSLSQEVYVSDGCALNEKENTCPEPAFRRFWLNLTSLHSENYHLERFRRAV